MLRFHVPNMSCGGCAKAVARAVQSADANARVDVDLGTRTISVATGTDAARLVEALRRAGYPAEARA